MTDDRPLLVPWHNGKFWRALCPDCQWDTKVLPFPNPDEALHALSLHKAVAHD